MQEQKPAILIQSQYIKDLSMEIPHAPQIFSKLRGKNPNVNVSLDINTEKLDDHVFNVMMNITINGDVEKEKAFILELTYAAVVTVNVPAEHEEPVLMVEIPHMIYPYAREIVSTTLGQAGLPPMLLNPIDFMGMYQAKKQAPANKQ
ncbi:MAG: protein-export chaperone SecB [bacterium]|nr:protein-export chaperone SecB [bacterium]MDY2830783.1 protein-export chaperone SecB [Alphaproteobacteria bacterium]